MLLDEAFRREVHEEFDEWKRDRKASDERQELEEMTGQTSRKARLRRWAWEWFDEGREIVAIGERLA